MNDSKERKIPLIMIAAGLALYLLAAFMHAGPSGVLPTLLAVLVVAVVQTAVLIGAAFIVAAMMSVSFGDVQSAILKFAGITLASGGLASVISFGGNFVALFIFLGLVMWLFELELTYSIALTVIYFVIIFVIAISVRAVTA
jgi:hypothetical protein